MTFEELTNRLPLITGGLFAISIFFVFLAVVYFRRGRRAPYWTQRRTAGQQGLRILMIGVFFLTITAISCGLTLIYNYIEPDETVEDNTNNTAVAFETRPAQPVTVFPTTENTEEPLVTATSADATDEPTSESTVEPSATEEVVVTEEATPTEPDPTATSESPTEIVDDTEDPTSASDGAGPSSANGSNNNDITATEIPSSPTATETIMPPSDTPTETEAPTLTETVPPTETPTFTPSFTATETATLPPTETPVPTDTPTLAATAIVYASNVRPIRTPSSLADLDILVVASGISERQQPLNSGLSFGSDLTRLYYFVKFDNMVGGSLWKVRLYRSGVLIYERSALWGNTATGETYFFIELPDGFAPGDYELQLSVGDQPNPLTTTSFSVNE